MPACKPLYDGILLNCTIVSDTHIDIKHPTPWFPKRKLKQALRDSQKNKAPVDAFITVGDTTSRGSDINWKLAKECFAKYNPAKKILLAVGNHDTWSDEGFEEAIERYFRNSAEICGVRREKTYFGENLNGYRLLFLGSEGDLEDCAAHISEEQLSWLRGELEAAQGKPTFVFCHQSLNQKHGLPRTWDKVEKPREPHEGGLGPCSDAVEAVLKDFKNVFYFSGHSHMGLAGENLKQKEGYASIEQEGDLYLINLPSLACGNHHGEDQSMGVGIQLEVYADRVVLRPRNYAKRKFTKVSMQNGNPYYEVKI